MRWIVKREVIKLFPEGVFPKLGTYTVNADLVIQGTPQAFTDTYGTKHPAQVLIAWTEEELKEIGVICDRTPDRRDPVRQQELDIEEAERLALEQVEQLKGVEAS